MHRALDQPRSHNPATGGRPRQSGKTTRWTRPLCADLNVAPHVLREQVLAASPPVAVIDEVQKIPDLDLFHT
jgi:hypothetical protein